MELEIEQKIGKALKADKDKKLTNCSTPLSLESLNYLILEDEFPRKRESTTSCALSLEILDFEGQRCGAV